MTDLTEQFQQNILDNVKKFSEISAKVLNSMLSVSFKNEEPSIQSDGIMIHNNKVIVSIMFTGMVYGEYLIVFDEDVGARIIAAATGDTTPKNKTELHTAIIDTFGELLNIIVGESIVQLGETFKKLTITAPKVLFGQATYPKVRTGQALLTSAQGNILCCLYVDRMKLDIASSYKDAMSSLVQANKELQNALEKLHEQQAYLIQAEKMGALGTMAAGVAHEINTPLATISLLGEQLKDMATEETQFDRQLFLKTLTSIDTTVVRISKITNSLKTFAIGIRGEAEIAKPIKELIENSLLLCEQSLLQKGIQVTTQLNDSVVLCRPTEIFQVLINLIANSRDAIEELPTKWIKIEVQDSLDKVQIRVTDSGAPIPTEIQTKIFDPFFTTKQFGQGTGLGLSVAKGIMHAHNGDIELDSTQPHPCFVVSFAKAPLPAPS